MKVVMASDTTGTHLRKALMSYLNGFPYEITVMVDEEPYPETAHETARRVAAGEYDRGILICGTGLGMAMMANKVRGVWAGTCSEPEQARRLAASNGAQILCIGSEIVSTQKAKKIVTAFLGAPFGDRPNMRRMRELEDQK